MQWGPAARREGPAGHKGEEKAGAAAPKDPTAAGDPGPQPRDECESRTDTFIHTKTHTDFKSHHSRVHALCKHRF